EDADLVEAALSFEPRIDVERLATRVGISPTRVGNALGLLASSGQVGFDLVAHTYFHRPLPVRRGALDESHPRLSNARKLVASGAVSAGPDASYTIRSAETPYTVRLAADPADDRCTCPWYAKHFGTRGPCKHVLAARLVSQEPTR
ncbi:MAG: SWIM zinc finger family protein, partial [Actinobacteria bacterium]|nr:SWIM zinc finger family protein [Actinomycetota bacterium]